MNQYATTILGLLAAYLVYFVVSTLVSNRYHARKAKELGCREPYDRPYRYPLAIDLTQLILKADKENVVPSYFQEMYNIVGKRATWRQNFLGTQAYVTGDPKNIQAVLATQFNDFEIGPIRRANFFPMLGNGIFTVDGKAW